MVGIDMTTKPDIDTNKAEESQTFSTQPQAKQEIYPEVSGRFKGLVIWLGLGFIVAVFLVQHYSGYN